MTSLDGQEFGRLVAEAPKPKPQNHNRIYVEPSTPVPEHRRYHVSNNALRGYDPRDEMRVLRGE